MSSSTSRGGRRTTEQRPKSAESLADLRAEPLLLAVVVSLSAVVVVPGTLDPAMLPKLTAVLVGAVLLVAAIAARTVIERRSAVPWGRPMAPVGLFGLALVVSTITSGNVRQSLLGVFERWTGLIPYTAYLVLLLVVVVLGRAAVKPLLVSLLLALAVVTLYALLQVVGLDPMDWNRNGLPPIFSLFGNVNFASGWTGAVIPLVVSGALHTTDRRTRAALLALLAGAVVLLWQASSTQGPIAAAAGSALVLAFWAKEQEGGRPLAALVRRRLPVLLAVTSLIGAVAAALLVTLRPDVGSRQRVHFWDAALSIFVDHPVFGSGLDTYGDLFLAYRSVDGAVLYGTERSDAPHSVPLGMFSNGGLVLGLAYLVFVVTVAVILVRGLRATRGQDRVWLAAFGGVWIGYQVQSLVSFDVPPLAVLHYVSAGAILVLSGVRCTRLVELSGYRQRARRSRRGRTAEPSGADIAGLVALSAVALLLVVFATRPLRADLAVGSAAPLVDKGRGAEALERFERGIDLAPDEARYRLLKARLLLAAGEREAALVSFTDAAELDRGSAQYALAASQLSAELGRHEEASRWRAEAVERDPHNPEVLLRVARAELMAGDPDGAQELAERAGRLNSEPESLVVLADVALARGDVDLAIDTLRRVLALDPGNERARQTLNDIREGAANR